MVNNKRVYAAPGIDCCCDCLWGSRGVGEVGREVTEGVGVGELKVLEG